jgi:cobalt/nickel transport system permease protein
MVLLAPLGLLADGTAFGEDAPADLDLERYHLDAVPTGLARYAGFWHNTLFDGYSFADESNPVLAYLLSAAVGVAAIALGGAAAVVAVRRLRRRSVVAAAVP